MYIKKKLVHPILVVYPRRNQYEWVSPLENSGHKLDIMADCEAQDQQKQTLLMVFSNKKQNKFEYDSEN